MAVMLGLGLWGLDRGTMWRDESVTYQMARRTLPQIRHALGTVDAVHGLYYLLMHPVLALWPSEVTMRLPSVLAAVAATALVAALGCRLARPRVGLWAGLLYATTPVVTHYAQEGRSYALVAASAAGATYLLVGAAGLAPEASGGGSRAGSRGVRRAASRTTGRARGWWVGRTAGPAAGRATSRAGWAGGQAGSRADRPARGPALGPGEGTALAPGPAPGAAPTPPPASGPGAASATRVRSAVRVRGDAPRLAPGPGPGPGGPEARGRAAGWRWAAYGGVVAVTALLHVFAVLMLAAHALTLLVSRAPRRVWWGWGSAAAGAVGAVVPLALVARRQSAQIAWIRHPTPGRLWAVVEEFAGPSALVLAVNLLLLAIAVIRPRRRTLTAVALPLICVPPVLLFALALHRPCFHERYLLFALAGIPLLAAAGADRLAEAVAGRPVETLAARRRAVVAAAGVVAIGCAFGWQFPLHQREREPLSRQDDLAALSAAVGRLTLPGEPVLYDPPKERRIAIAYPRPLAGLRDIALATPGPASGTLYGVDVGPTELLRRLDGARSAWLIAADEPETRGPKAPVLTGHFRLAYSLCLPGVRLERYVRVGPAH
ncbi:glycosyltransferase family 39 protein [Streptomyces sp. NEAU-174]|uniref:glycosyltransferase family 39 protein n=1 Tax=Streptomyces sp. NEAU-174 TaxID=3458254 RepID=UPI00404422E8